MTASSVFTSSTLEHHAVDTSSAEQPSAAVPTSDPSDTKNVLLIGGLGRSGSTLIESVLGQIPGYVNVGELVHLWVRGLSEDELTGDGTPFWSSPTWQRIGQRAFGGWDQVDVEDVRALQQRVDRQRFLPLMLSPKRPEGFQADMTRYTDLLARVYSAIKDEHDAKVIVDASKHGSHAFLLREVPGVRFKVVHLVRDARGVAYSWTKKVRKPEVTAEEAYMHTYHPGRMASRWVSTNAEFHLLDRLGVETLFVRYEDFAASPKDVTRQILDFAGHTPADDELPFLDDTTVAIRTASPTIAGNPMRFQGGNEIRIRTDRAWQDKLAARDRRTVTAITAPMLARYGYAADGTVKPLPSRAPKDTR